MDVRGRIHRRIFGTRRRRRAVGSALLIGSMVGTASFVGLLSAGAATTNGDPVLWAQTQCIATLFGSSTIMQPQDVTVQAVVPNSVAQSAAYDATIPGGTATLPSNAQGFTISGYKNIGQTYLFRSSSGTPAITNIVANGGATSNGNPVTFNTSFTNEGSATAVTSAAWDSALGGRITYNTGVAHNLSKYQTVDISGFGKAGYNVSGALVRAVPSTTQFQVTGRPIPVTAGTWSGGVITLTTAFDHRLHIGDEVTTVGMIPNRYNGQKTITGIPAPNQFTFAGGATDPGSATVTGASVVDTLAEPGRRPVRPSGACTR